MLILDEKLSKNSKSKLETLVEKNNQKIIIPPRNYSTNNMEKSFPNNKDNELYIVNLRHSSESKVDRNLIIKKAKNNLKNVSRINNRGTRNDKTIEINQKDCNNILNKSQCRI